MAVVGNAEEREEDQNASFDGGTWSYTRAWLVKVDSKQDRENVVSAANGLPAYGAPHPTPISDPAYAKTISYSRVSGSALAWIVTVTYSSERELQDDPTNDEILVSWTSEIYQELVRVDRDGDAVVNSAGDPFVDPVPTRDAIHLIAKIKANISSAPDWIVAFQNAVNDAEITIGGLTIAVGLARVQRIEIGERKKRGNATYYPLSYEVHIHKDGWRLKPLDAGFRKLDGTDRVQIRDKDDDEPTTPVPLNGSGQPIANPTPDNAHFLDFTVYDELSLSALPGIT